MTEEVREEDEWLYGESADGIVPPASGVAPNEDTMESREPDSTAADSNEVPLEADIETAADEVEPTEETTQDGSRGKKRGGDAIEGQGSSDEQKGEENETEDDDEDSDEDGIEVIIGDVKAQSGTAPGFAGKRSGAPPPDKKGKFSTEDFEGPGQINGVPAQDFNLDTLEDKPWRKPGADITDYFNYGFTEETWRAYSERQKRLRYEAGHQGHQMPGSGDIKYIGIAGQQNIVFPKKFGMQGQRKDGPMNMMGGIHMGMGMRRDNPSENSIQVMTADRREYSRKQFEMSGPMMGPPPPFDMSIPPPPFPPRGEFMGPPPEFFNHPPQQDYYNEGPEYIEQQWMDSQWEMEGEQRVGPGPSALVVPLTKVVEVPPPPGESDDGPPPDSIKIENS